VKQGSLASLAMSLKQEVFWMIWDTELRTWKSNVDGDDLEGSWNSIVHKMSDKGWEITTVTPMTWSASYGSKGPGILDDSIATPQLIAITAKQVN